MSEKEREKDPQVKLGKRTPPRDLDLGIPLDRAIFLAFGAKWSKNYSVLRTRYVHNPYS